jgi:ribonuclease J
MVTGSQAEPRAALSRIAEGTHPNLKLLPGDTVILSSKIIPGNEVKIFRMLNLLCLGGIEVMTEKDHKIHVSGHPYRGELKRMYDYVKPKIAIPVHGEARHIQEHAKFARELGVPHAVEIKNGELLKLAPNKPEKVAIIKSGRLAIDGFAFHAGDSEIMRSRRKMRVGGAVFASLVVDKKGGLADLPQISAPGLLDSEHDADFLAALAEDIDAAVAGKKDAKLIAEQARKTIKKLMRDELDKNPIIEVHVAKS